MTLNPGDILIADSEAFGGTGAVFRVDPINGAKTTVSLGGSFVDPTSIAIAANGDLLVTDRNAFGGPGGVIRVNPTTGAQTTVSSGGASLTPSASRSPRTATSSLSTTTAVAARTVG